jgi:hypothetical protein
MLIQTSSIGLGTTLLDVYVASDKLNNWCQGNCDFSAQSKLSLSKDGTFAGIDAAEFLSTGDEFKLVIPSLGAKRAAAAYALQLDARVHSNRRFDYDPGTGHFWYLPPTMVLFTQENGIKIMSLI